MKSLKVFFSDFFSMSNLSADATPFVPVFQLLQQINALAVQLQNQIKIVDLFLPSTTQKIKFTSSADMSLPSVSNKSSYTISESPFRSQRAYKRYLRSKAWRDRQREHVHTLPASQPPRHFNSNFIKYLKDYKKGKFQSANGILISTSKEGGVISALSPSDVPSSIILNPPSTLPIHEKSATMDISVKSGVILTSNSPQVRCLSRNPPRSRLPSVSSSSSSLHSLNFNTIPISAWPSHYSKIFNLFYSSSFTEKGCVLSKPKDFLDAGAKIRGIVAFVKDNTPVTLPEYFHYSLFHCSIAFCRTHLKCCNGCGRTSHSETYCDASCSDCPSADHRFHSCPKFLSWLHDSKTSYHSTWRKLVANWILTYPPPTFKD